MTLECFREEFRGLIRAVWGDRLFILGQSRETAWSHSDTAWPQDHAAQLKEMRRRVHEHFEPPSPPVPDRGTLERVFAITSKQSLNISYTGGESGNDAAWMVVKKSPSRFRVLRDVANLYLHFSHEDPKETQRAVDCLWHRMLVETPGINWFRVAGPSVTRQARVSLHLHLSERGSREKHAIADEIGGRVQFLPETYFGTQKIREGVGFAKQPKPPEGSSDWKTCFGRGEDYGEFLSIYLAQGLRAMAGMKAAEQSVEVFASKIAAVLRQDNIAPEHLHLLSSATSEKFEGISGWGVS